METVFSCKFVFIVGIPKPCFAHHYRYSLVIQLSIALYLRIIIILNFYMAITFENGLAYMKCFIYHWNKCPFLFVSKVGLSYICNRPLYHFTAGWCLSYWCVIIVYLDMQKNTKLDWLVNAIFSKSQRWKCVLSFLSILIFLDLD